MIWVAIGWLVLMLAVLAGGTRARRGCDHEALPNVLVKADDGRRWIVTGRTPDGYLEGYPEDPS